MLAEVKLVKLLEQKKLTLGIAESCSGGLLSNRITNIPGSSTVFLLGTITYANESKSKILQVPAQLMKTKGSVSVHTAKAMALGIRKLSGASFGVSITGIAGPAGGTKDKPIGTVFIGISSNKKTFASQLNFSGNRLEIKRKSTSKAITMLLQYLVTAEKACKSAKG